MTEKNKPVMPEVVTDEDGKEAKQLISQNVKPDMLYLVPIAGRPHLPAQIQPLIVNKQMWEKTLKKASELSNGLVGLTYLKETKKPDVTKEDFPKVGCIVRMINFSEVEGNLQFVAQGLERFRIVRFLSDKPPFAVQVEYFKKHKENPEQLKAYAISIINLIKQLLALNPLYTEELKQYLGRFSPVDPSPLTDFAAGITSASGDELQKV